MVDSYNWKGPEGSKVKERVPGENYKTLLKHHQKLSNQINKQPGSGVLTVLVNTKRYFNLARAKNKRMSRKNYRRVVIQTF